MKKSLCTLLVSSLLLSSLTACGTAEPESSQVKIDPITVGQVAAGIYGAYSSYMSDRANSQKLAQLKAEIQRSTQQILATMHQLNDAKLVTASTSLVETFANVHNWTDQDFSNAYFPTVNLKNELVDRLRNGPPESAPALAQSLALISPIVAIVLTIKGHDEAQVRDVVWIPAYDAFEIFLSAKFPQYLRNRTPPPPQGFPAAVFPWTTIWFDMGKAWQWEGQIAAMFQIIAPMEPEYLVIENAQRSVGTFIGRAGTPRKQLEGTHKVRTGWVGEFDGRGGFCGYAHPDHMAHAGKSHKAILENGFTMSEKYLNVSGLVNRGVCKVSIPTGFFRVHSQAEIYWSNGGDAYCYIPHPRYVTGPVSIYNYNVHEATSFRKDSTCPGM